jgi:hypothetical protein
MEGQDADEFDGFINEIIERKFSFQVNVSRADPSTLIDVTVDEETTDSDAESKEKVPLASFPSVLFVSFFLLYPAGGGRAPREAQNYIFSRKNKPIEANWEIKKGA